MGRWLRRRGPEGELRRLDPIDEDLSRLARHRPEFQAPAALALDAASDELDALELEEALGELDVQRPDIGEPFDDARASEQLRLETIALGAEMQEAVDQELHQVDPVAFGL